MKKIYFILFSLVILVILFVSLYFINIPSPSKLITEVYKLSIK